MLKLNAYCDECNLKYQPDPKFSHHPKDLPISPNTLNDFENYFENNYNISINLCGCRQNNSTEITNYYKELFTNSNYEIIWYYLWRTIHITNITYAHKYGLFVVDYLSDEDIKFKHNDMIIEGDFENYIKKESIISIPLIDMDRNRVDKQIRKISPYKLGKTLDNVIFALETL